MEKYKGLELHLYRFWIYDRQDEYPEKICVIHYSKDMARQLLRKDYTSKWWRVGKVEELSFEPRVFH